MSTRILFGAALSSLLGLFGLVSLTQQALADSGATTIVIKVVNQEEHGVVSQVWAGAPDMKPAGTTDANGVLPLRRNCQVGEVIEAHPVEAIVYYPSDPLTCEKNLVITVKRRPFADSGIIATYSDVFGSQGKDKYYAFTRLTLEKTIRNVTDPNIAGHQNCEMKMEPLLKTDIWKIAPNKELAPSNSGQFMLNAIDIPKKVVFSTDCGRAGEQIKEEIERALSSLVDFAATSGSATSTEAFYNTARGASISVEGLQSSGDVARWLRDSKDISWKGVISSSPN
jgi:hypothetical protein